MEEAEPLPLAAGLNEPAILLEAVGVAERLVLALGVLERVSDAVVEALATSKGEGDGDGEPETAGDVPETVTLAHLNVPPFAVAPSPIIAPQKFALSSAAAGRVPLPERGVVDSVKEKMAEEEKLDVALPVDENTMFNDVGPVPLACVPVTATTMPLQPTVDVQKM